MTSGGFHDLNVGVRQYRARGHLGGGMAVVRIYSRQACSGVELSAVAM